MNGVLALKFQDSASQVQPLCLGDRAWSANTLEIKLSRTHNPCAQAPNLLKSALHVSSPKETMKGLKTGFWWALEIS